jgi:hypothetical protein
MLKPRLDPPRFFDSSYLKHFKNNQSLPAARRRHSRYGDGAQWERRLRAG